ncbi:MAG: DUF5658 family protein [Armatimonadota bacterium]|nr:DUF5658 family protein [Armatimonadota bacterium]
MTVTPLEIPARAFCIWKDSPGRDRRSLSAKKGNGKAGRFHLAGADRSIFLGGRLLSLFEMLQVAAWVFFLFSAVVSWLLTRRLRVIVYNHLRHRQSPSWTIAPFAFAHRQPSERPLRETATDERGAFRLRLLLFLALNVTDLGLSTWFLLQKWAVELNPIGAFLWEAGLPWFVSVKLLVTGAIALILTAIHQVNPRLGTFGFDAANGILAVVLILAYFQAFVVMVR